MVLSNKAILPVLYELFPDSPYLLRAEFEPFGDTYVFKPIYSREGANVGLSCRRTACQDAGRRQPTGRGHLVPGEVGRRAGAQRLHHLRCVPGRAVGRCETERRHGERAKSRDQQPVILPPCRQAPCML